MANFMGMALARDIHLGRVLGAGRAPRGALLEGVRVYTSDQTHFSIASGARPARLPARDAGGHPVGRPVPAARRAGRGGRRPRPRRRPDPVRDRGRGRIDEHRIGRRRRRAGRRRGRGGPVAPRRRRVWRGRAAVGARRRPGPRPRSGRFGHGRSAQVVLPGLRHRRAARARRGASRAGRSAAGRPSTTAVARRRPTGSATTATTTANSSTSTSSASRAPAAGARSSSGCRGSTSAPRVSPG